MLKIKHQFIRIDKDSMNNEFDLIDNSSPTIYEISSLGYMNSGDDWIKCVTVFDDNLENTRTFSLAYFTKHFKTLI